MNRPTLPRVLHSCNMLLQKGAPWTSFTINQQQTCPCTTTSAPRGREQMEELIPPLWTSTSQLASNALMPTQGPQLALPVSPTSQQAAPFQLSENRDTRGEEEVMAFPPSLFAASLESTDALPFPNPAEPAANPSLDICCPSFVGGYCSPETFRLFVGTVLCPARSKCWFPSLQS